MLAILSVTEMASIEQGAEASTIVIRHALVLNCREMKVCDVRIHLLKNADTQTHLVLPWSRHGGRLILASS